ncbi:MAG: PaaI family thioesterase [Acetatifactor sp.]
MPTLKEIKERFQRDRFATETTGVEIVEAKPGRALCKLSLRPELLNANEVPMGGAIFTLADFAFAVASNAYSEAMTVSQHASMNFLAAAKGTTLYAEAVCLKAGRRTCLYQINVTDDAGIFVAYMTVNGFTSEPKPGI